MGVSIVNNVTYSDNTGFKSALFERTINGKSEFTYAFAGTENADDWEANFDQLFAASKQYDNAINNTKIIIRDIGNKELTLTGHSLGGSLANAAALATGKASITFNPAWISTGTAAKYGLLFRPQTGIANYIISGEILNAIQTKANTPIIPFLQHVGQDHFLQSKSLLTSLPIWGPIGDHLIGSVIKAIDAVPEYNRVKGESGAGGQW